MILTGWIHVAVRMAQTDVALVQIVVPAAEAGVFNLQTQVLIGFGDTTLGASRLKFFNGDSSRDAGIAAVTAGLIQVAAAAAKSSIGERLVKT